jgi:hypothetical protein
MTPGRRRSSFGDSFRKSCERRTLTCWRCSSRLGTSPRALSRGSWLGRRGPRRSPRAARASLSDDRLAGLEEALALGRRVPHEVLVEAAEELLRLRPGDPRSSRHGRLLFPLTVPRTGGSRLGENTAVPTPDARRHHAVLERQSRVQPRFIKPSMARHVTSLPARWLSEAAPHARDARSGLPASPDAPRHCAVGPPILAACAPAPPVGSK